MANRAVVGAAAAAAGIYFLSERVKEAQCRLEEEEERQRTADNRARLAEKLAEEERFGKKKHQKGKEPKPGATASRLEFQHNGFAQSRLFLLKALEEIRDRAKKRSRMERYLGQVNLLLLSSRKHQNSPEEIVFGAALALGDDQVLEELFQEEIIKWNPSLVVSRLSLDSICFIARCLRDLGTFRDLFTDMDVKKQRPRHSYITSIIPSKWIAALLGFVVFDPPGRPRVNMLEKDDGQTAAFFTFQECAAVFGLSVDLDSNYTVGSPTTSKLDLDGLRHFKLKFSPKYQNQRTSSFDECKQLILGNFKGPFSLKGTVSEDDKWTLSEAQPTKKFKISSPADLDRQHATGLFASLMASQNLLEAALRLEAMIPAMRKSSHGKISISIEFLSVWSGLDGHFVASVRDGTRDLFEKNETSFAANLAKQLKEFVPAAQTAGVIDDSADVDDEISSFVRNYLRLFELSCCVVPTAINGKPPSSFVPKTSVKDIALSSLFEPTPRSSQRVARSMELGERDRLIRSREIVTIAKGKVLLCILVIGIFLYWLAFTSFCSALPRKVLLKHLSGGQFMVFLHAITAIVTMWAFSNLMQILKAPMHVKESELKSKIPMVSNETFAVASAIAERLDGMIPNRRSRKGTLFEQELSRLQRCCDEQFRVWRIRCAQRDFYDALDRKQITNGSLRELIECFAVPNNMKSEVRGVFPGTFKQAKEFLSAKVIYEEEEGDSFEETFNRIAADVKAFLVVEFPVGARVQVAVDDSPSYGAHLLSTTTIVKRSSSTGLIVASYPKTLLVRFDGDNSDQFVPTRLCTVMERPSTLGTKNKKTNAKRTANGQPDWGFAPRRDSRSPDEPSDRIDTEAESANVPSTRRKQKVKTRPTVPMEHEKENSKKKQQKKSSSKAKGSGFRRARTVKEALEDHGWTLVREKNHLVFRRSVVDEEGEVADIQFTMTKTPSDVRASKNALSKLNRINRQYHNDSDSDSSASDAQRDNNLIVCNVCYAKKAEDQFSRSQLKKETHKCKDCVAGNIEYCKLDLN